MTLELGPELQLVPAVYAVTDGSYLAVRVVQMFLGLVSAFLVYLLTRRLFGRLAGLLACFIMSTYWVFIFYDGELHSPTLNVFLLLSLKFRGLLWVRRDSRSRRAGHSQ